MCVPAISSTTYSAISTSGKHPTANRNSYLVLYLNFSGITGELNDYRKGLDAHCSITFMNFCKIYADLLPPETLEELRQVNGVVEQLDYLYQACERAGQKMYLFIDEIRPLHQRHPF